MTEVRLTAIVEGHGESEAVPILIRRIASDIASDLVLKIHPPWRVPASRLLKQGELERTLEVAARKLEGHGGIIVILDCDWDGCCPAREGPALLERARAARSDIPVAVVFAKQEFESWFIAAAESLRGERTLAADLKSPQDPENIRGAKEWLSEHMASGRSYSATVDQPALAQIFDMTAARKADSFDKCYREVHSLLEKLVRSS